MPTTPKKIQYKAPAFILSLCVLSNLATADIQEIPAEEMTESYIQDTTVIVPKASHQITNEVSVTVEQNEGYSDSQVLGDKYEPNNEGLKRPDLTPLSDENLAKHQADSLYLQNSSVPVPSYDYKIQEYDNQLRQTLLDNKIPLESLGIPKEGPIDYSQLQFPAGGLSTNLPLPEGLNFSSKADQFIISIPNNGYSNQSQNLTPGGEFQIQMNNDQIQFIINRPNSQ